MQGKTRQKAALVSLGCSKNLVDSEIMLANLSAAGYELTARAEEAQLVVVNTCGFIESAKKESIDAILQAADLKKSGSCRKLVVTGCLSQRYRGELARELPEVDLFLGTNEYDRIAELAVNGDGRREVYSHHLIAYEKPLARVLATPSYSAYLKIAEGCSRPCTFCVIPRIRGRFRSRPSGALLEEARRLTEQGVQELNLIAQDINYYGRDRAGELHLPELLSELNRIEGLRWIRVLYNYPLGLDDPLLEAYASLEKVCKYVDLPLQHISDPILSAMRRGISRDGTYRLVERIREKIPGAVLRTTFIVGFPGETEDDFEELLEFVRRSRFHRLGVFTYSREEGSMAGALPGQVPGKVARRRQEALMKLQAGIAAELHRELVGTTQEVLVEGVSEESDLLLQGRLSTQAPEIDGVVYLNDGSAAPGEFVRAEITESHTYDLVGRILSPS